MRMPTDLPSYAHYHMIKNQKNYDQASLVFCDLTPSELKTAFITTMSDLDRHQLKKELKYLTLLDTTQWLADNFKYGCSQCASYLNRSKVTSFPRRPIQLLGEEQMPSFVTREKSIAHNILRTVL